MLTMRVSAIPITVQIFIICRSLMSPDLLPCVLCLRSLLLPPRPAGRSGVFERFSLTYYPKTSVHLCFSRTFPFRLFTLTTDSRNTSFATSFFKPPEQGSIRAGSCPPKPRWQALIRTFCPGSPYFDCPFKGCLCV